MDIILKSDWDVRLQPPIYGLERKGHFAGRKEEIEHLVNEILRRENGAIAISGYRGVGKTSLVYYALHEVRQRLGNEKSIIVVLINAAQFERGSKYQSIEPKTIMINLIQRLYSTIEFDKIEEQKQNFSSRINILKNLLTQRLQSTSRKNSKSLSLSEEEKNHLNDFNEKTIYISEKLKHKIEVLYHKAIASEYSSVENIIKSKLYYKEAIKEKNFEVTPKIELLFHPFVMFSWFYGGIILIISKLGLLYSYLIPIGITAAPLVFNFIYKRNLIKKQHEEMENNFREMYKFDNSLGNLEFDLEEIHKEISTYGKIKLIYVIDEMDKLDLEYGMDIISHFKNFFTLTNAYFIFINGEKMHNWGETEKTPKKQIQSTLVNDNKEYPEKEYRPKEYTYFTSRYFLSRPLTKDLDDFLKDIVENIESVKDQEHFDILKRAIYFDAKNDFFDIKTCIKDRITNFDEKNDFSPIIQYPKDDLVLNDDIKKARFYSIVSYLFEKHFMVSKPTKWQDNEILLRELFSYVGEIYSSDTGTKFSDPDDDKTLSEAKRDLNNLLFKNGAFKILESNEKTIKGSQVKINEYEYSGDIPHETKYHDETDITEYEKRFITIFQEYSNYINLLYNVYRNIKSNIFNCPDKFEIPYHFVLEQTSKWGFSTISQFNYYSSIYSTITTEKQDSSIENLSMREKIIPKTEELDKHMIILVNDLPNIIAQMIRNRQLDKNLNVQTLKENQSFLKIFSGELHNFLQNFHHSVVSNNKGTLTRQLLIINNKSLNDEKEIEQFSNKTIEQIQNEVKKNADTHKVVIITDISMPNSDGVYIIQNKITKELCDELTILLNNIIRFFW